MLPKLRLIFAYEFDYTVEEFDHLVDDPHSP